MKQVFAALCFLVAAFPLTLPAASAASKDAVVRIGDTSISRDEFDQAVDLAARRKFYHGKTPEGEVAALQREVAQNMVDNVLLLKEAKRRGLKPDAASISRAIGEYESRYRASDQWQMRRTVLLSKLQKQLETDSLLQQLHTLVHDVAQPDAVQLKVFYDANLDKFTEPERSRVSTILIKVDPSSPKAVWDKARIEAVALVKKLRRGTDFAQQARQRSGDESAGNGGDMGYLHRGMLAEPAQEVVDKLKVNEIAEPVTLLQGVGIFRLDERKAALLNPLTKVEQRARDLWRREQGEHAWQALLATLRRSATTVIDESVFVPVFSSADTTRIPTKVK